MKENLFITLEGGEGSGKTSAIKHIKKFIEKMGRKCVITREPGGTEIGMKIRKILLDPCNDGIEPYTELLLYIADRAQHVKTVIDPALMTGKIVICDRYSDTTMVYQGFVRKISFHTLKEIHRMVGADTKPDITFLLDLPAEVGLARAWEQINSNERTGDESRFEKEALEFHKKIRKGYLNLAKREPKRWFIVDVEKNDEIQTAKIICAEIEKRFFKNPKGGRDAIRTE